MFYFQDGRQLMKARSSLNRNRTLCWILTFLAVSILQFFSGCNSNTSVDFLRVSPGNHEVCSGDRVKISVSVYALKENRDPQVILESINGPKSIVRRQMHLAVSTKTETAKIFTCEVIVNQDCDYRIKIDNKYSDQYRITVLPPEFKLTSLTLIPPDYTRMPSKSLALDRPINGLEGSILKFSAEANFDLDIAQIELLTTPKKTGKEQVVERIKVAVNGKQAKGEFVLRSNSAMPYEDSTNYQLRLTAKNAKLLAAPVIIPVNVSRDLGPLIQVVSPKHEKLEVAVNRKFKFVVQAKDQDFDIAEIKANLLFRKIRLVKERLQLTREGSGEFVSGVFEFDPSKWNLNPGDELTFFATAADNRHHFKNGLPDPNYANSLQYSIKILPPKCD